MDLKKTYHLSCGWETLIVAPPGSLQTTFTALCLQFTFTALHLGLAFRAAGLDFKIATSFTGWWLDLPLKNISQMGVLFPNNYMEKNMFQNHQPV